MIPLDPIQVTRNLIRVYLIAFLADLALGIIVVTFPLYAKSIGSSVFVLSIVVSATGAANVVSQIYLGHMSDREGRKVVQGLGLLFFIVFPVFSTLIHDPLLLVVPGIMQGIGIVVFMMAAAYVGDVAREGDVDKKMAWLMVSQGLGFSVGPFVGGYVIDVWGYASAYYLASVTSAAAFAVLLGLKEEAVKSKSEQGEFFSKSRSILRRRSIIAVTLMSILTTFGMRSVTTFVPLRGRELGMAGSLIGSIVGVRNIASTILRLPAGFLAGSFGRRKMLFLSLILTGSALALLGTVASLELVLFAVCLEGIGFGIFLTLRQAYVVSITDRSERAMSLGLVGSVGWPGETALVLSLGALSEVAGLTSMFLVGSVVVLMGGVASSYLLRTAKEKAE